MTKEEAKEIIMLPPKQYVLFALVYFVNLKDCEFNVLICRFMRGLTQSKTAEELNCAVNTVQNWESSALEKCASAWEDNDFINTLLQKYSKS